MRLCAPCFIGADSLVMGWTANVSGPFLNLDSHQARRQSFFEKEREEYGYKGKGR